MATALVDTRNRPLRNLRVSVTDRCNLRCGYCMPEEDYVWLPREEILHFEEISRLVDVFIELGVDKVGSPRRAAAAPRPAGARGSALGPAGAPRPFAIHDERRAPG